MISFVTLLISILASRPEILSVLDCLFGLQQSTDIIFFCCFSEFGINSGLVIALVMGANEVAQTLGLEFNYILRVLTINGWRPLVLFVLCGITIINMFLVFYYFHDPFKVERRSTMELGADLDGQLIEFSDTIL